MVRRPPGARFDSRYVIPTVKHSSSVMIWGNFSASGLGNLWFLPTNSTMNAARYLGVLQERLKPIMRNRQATIFMHDSAPCHQAKSVKQWLASENIEVLASWPGNSPDLNPIENLWTVLKIKVASHNPSSQTELVEAVKRVWCTEITQNLCKKLVERMPKRIAAVIRNGSRSSKY